MKPGMKNFLLIGRGNDGTHDMLPMSSDIRPKSPMVRAVSSSSTIY